MFIRANLDVRVLVSHTRTFLGGSIVFAYHNQAEVNDPNSTGYTAGRINFDVTDSSGSPNVDPNASNLKYTLTLDVGDSLTGQEYVVTY
ncbi:MAG TPA: hypothetical protein VNG51_15935 [Ktedonobacteraceae bacterium]|nr:hypothetical protein [Ktedonobacteraceae bacterium]